MTYRDCWLDWLWLDTLLARLVWSWQLQAELVWT